jgi:asparagine synthase (glutamine-hydrolysing)
MCGIAGIINFGNLEITAPLFAMSRTLRHRGPDGEGFFLLQDHVEYPAYSNDTPPAVIQSSLPFAPKEDLHQLPKQLYSLGFAHRRLSIIDLNVTGHQPQSASGYWITFNGEIYNYQELRSQLMSEGVSFVGQSDTEVVLQMYIRYGKSCVQYFNGMWAMAIYDPHHKEVWLSRDITGVKPLYFYSDKDGIYFASEHKSLLSLREFGMLQTKVQSDAVFDYFIHSQVDYQGLGMFSGIEEVLGGEELIINLHSKTFVKQSFLPAKEYVGGYEAFDAEKSKKYALQVREAFVESVRLRLRSDVPVGACLSGGIDSSSIVSVMRHLQPNADIHTFTTVFPNSRYDESSYAKLVSQQSKTIWHDTTLNTSDLLNDLESLMYAQDVPIWSTSTYAQFRLMKLANEQGIKVVLDGQGGDELFGGYPHHLYSYFGESMMSNISSAARLFSQNTSFLSKSFFKNKILNAWGGMPSRLLSGNFREDISFFNPDFLQTHRSRFLNRYELRGSSLNQQLFDETHNTLLKNYLKCEDRCSMHFSVESRTPFSDDKELMKIAFNIPSSYKIHEGTFKYILRESMKDLLPKEVYARKDKMGYATPNNQFIYEIKDQVREYFSNPALEEFIDTKKLLQHYDQFFDARQQPENGRLFKFISFAVWMKVFEMK